MSTQRRAGLSLGASTILVTFVLLCITTFATMSLMSARADQTLTDKLVQNTGDYYAADAAAEERIAAIHNAAVSALGASSSADGFFGRLSHAGILWDSLDRPGTSNTATLRFNIPIREDQQLEVTYLLIYSAADHTAQMSCTGHRVVSTATDEDTGSEFPDLWTGPDGGGGLATPDFVLGG